MMILMPSAIALTSIFFAITTISRFNIHVSATHFDNYPHTHLNNQNSETARQAFELVAHNIDLPAESLSALLLVNKDSNQIIYETLKYKYLLSAVSNKQCLDRLFYDNPTKVPSHEHNNPIWYLHLFPNSHFIYPFNREFRVHLECLNNLVAKNVPVEIVTCSHPKFKYSTQCNEFNEDSTIGYIDLGGIALPWYPKRNITLAKRLLLAGAIRGSQYHLVEYLLHPSQQVEIGREHLIASLYAGNEPMFFRLISMLNMDHSRLRNLLHLETTSQCRDMAAIAILPITDYIPSPNMLRFLFTYIPLNDQHFRNAARRTESTLLRYLITHAKRIGMDTYTLNHVLIGCLYNAVLWSRKSDNTALLLDEITDTSMISKFLQYELVRAASRKPHFPELLALFKHKLDIDSDKVWKSIYQ